MWETNLMVLEVAFLLIATLYSITGHGGASGYIAVMALLGVAPQEMKPIALSLNIIVSVVATIQFYGAGHFRRELFLPFILGSLPLAMLGGYLQLPVPWFNALMGLVLIFAALRIFFRPVQTSKENAPAWGIACVVGAAIGLLSGLIGVGGGIFLTPLLLLLGWANPKQAAAVSAPFILLNSIAGLAGFSMQATHSLPPSTIWLALPVLVGGLVGSYLGSRSLAMRSISGVLSAVLLIAGAKLLYV
ncbi:MAG: sulfite exporter TauE/SafE family protein [Gallionellaceae bacterium]|nr:sulfite exporter TauE/SafE family protein [Gallionellaceae bacterium]